MRGTILAAAILSLTGLWARSGAAALVRGDSDFDLSGYDVIEVETGNVTPRPQPDGIGTITVTRQASGGASGAFARIVIAFHASAGSTGYGGIHAVVLRKELIDPAAEGGFVSARHVEWARQSSSGGDGQATGIAIKQGPSVYVARVECTPDVEWTFKCSAVAETSCRSDIGAINPVRPADFVLIQGPGPAEPDLSVSGAPFQLGFYRANSGPAGGPAGSRTADIDDWKVTLLPACAVDADCAEGDVCVSDVCDGGVCVGTCATCVDANPCTQDGCDATSGSCLFAPVADGVACGDDDDVCNGAETCQAGLCALGTPLVCDDGDSCTTDVCSRFEGCLSFDEATFEAAVAKIQEFLALVSGPACADQPLVKQLKKKLKKKAGKVRKLVLRADRATKIAAIDTLIAKAGGLLDAVRGLIATAVAADQLSAECAGELTAFLDGVQACVATVPRVP
jgi:hypothetical protein